MLTMDEHLRSIDDAVGAEPDNAEAWTNRGLAYAHHGRLDEAAASFARAVELEPDSPPLHNALAHMRAQLGDLDDALVHFHRALELAPDMPELHCNLGGALNDAGRLDEAETSLCRAISLNPALPQAHYNLGLVLMRQGRLLESRDAFRAAVELAPEFAEAHVNLGLVLWRLSDHTEAQLACRQALSLNPHIPEAHVNLGNVLKDLGAVGEAIAHYRQALMLRPGHLIAHANLIFSLHYLSSTTTEEVCAEIAAWNRLHTASVERLPPRPVDRNPRRRISVGYVSANLRTHPGGFFLGAVLAAHDRNSFEISCYVDAAEEDQHSRRIRESVDHWTPIASWSDDALAARIREDGIDILVDMNRFSGSCRLRAFARKPAPVQVTWMGGPVTTSGLDAIDYALSDAVHTPPALERTFVEKVVRLRNAYAVYQAPPYAPDVGPLPALGSGRVTFGSLNYLAKLGPETIGLWAEILDALPGSRILLQSKAFAQAGARERLIGEFSGRGVDSRRIVLEGGLDHCDLLDLYNQVDIALDPFPYAGGITTCEALWMGVPVVTMPGPVVTVRHTASHLLNAGLSEWIAGDPHSYRRCAIRLATDPGRLAGIRAGLRRRISTSQLCDAASFARELEEAYRAMWHDTKGYRS
jgi:protein O-GlcNAc transferase